MPRGLISLVFCLLLTLSGTALAQDEAAGEETQIYVIQPGDTLYSIARRHNTSVSALTQANGIVNPAHIFWGQRIRIPGEQAPAPQPESTPATTAPATLIPSPTQTTPLSASETTPTTYVVRPGDTLNRIALRNNTSIADILAANPDIRNRNLLYTNQRIIIPSPVDANEEAASERTIADISEAAPIASVDFGLEVNLLDQNAALSGSEVAALGANWVKQVVNWREFEPVAGEIDFAPLDLLINSLQSRNTKILLTVTAAPDWARSIQEENGPPNNFEDFASFMATLASRYAGQVTAYQIWNEPNLRSRWKSTVHPISAASYVDLLRQAQAAVKIADPNALVISAGLAPTGFNDALNAEAGNLEINAIDDRVFLSGMYAEGVADFVDAVGAHPIGWANPPDALCCAQTEGVQTHYENPHFYFANTLDDYRQIQLANGDSATPIWVTKFGWGTSEDLGQPDPINVFTSYTSLEQQAQYIVRAFDIGASFGFVGPMFAYNLNGCQAPGDDGLASCYYSLLGPDGAPRPVFAALQNLDISGVGKAEAGEETLAAQVTPEVVETTPEVSP